MSNELVLGEFRRSIDDKHRLSIPAELLDPLLGQSSNAVLAKERFGCLSFWDAGRWQTHFDAGVALVKQKLIAGKLDNRLVELQRLARLLSSRHTSVSLSQRGRLVIPAGFREFLGVEPGSDLMVIGAGVCVEIWQPAAWQSQLALEMPQFPQLFDQLAN